MKHLYKITTGEDIEWIAADSADDALAFVQRAIAQAHTVEEVPDDTVMQIAQCDDDGEDIPGMCEMTAREWANEPETMVVGRNY